ncbi:MAG: homogentisate 1,2-dioxygenase, partial [bacterium]|nr:homogentisate 1,2-dioxygenase [bacterium]
ESREPLRRPVFSWVNDTVPYVEHDLSIPDPVHCNDAPDDVFKNEASWYIQIKRGGRWADASYAHNPFSCVGYQGYPYPFVLPIENISLPTLSKEHTDPTSFMTFVSSSENGINMPDVGVSTFLSHRVHSLPYFHTNFFDECLFLSREYKARGGVLGPGDMSFHPQGFSHGPHPEALRSWKKPETSEDLPHVPMLAVMFESQSPLMPTTALLGQKDIEVPEYFKSWTLHKAGNKETAE